ncbi:spermatogenesis-associated protein 13 isoform X2 [Eucyclogobius newberryi]|uniref:spermatogenesis-associated protein 13 isoform X2 n=1 Tax=Eucyclogobius newberryi TaxID=166745 RepID=UPI003B5C471B
MVLVYCVPFRCICQGPDSDREVSEVTSEQPGGETLLQAEESSPAPSSTPSVSPMSLSDSPTSPTADTSSVQRRKRGRNPRLRPFSDYGQISQKQCIPEELLCERANGTLPDSNGRNVCEAGESTEDCSVDSDTPLQRPRPISVIGVLDVFDAEEKGDQPPSPLPRPPVPSHRVPPYRAVSARFRPSALSQSTPIGLDRVGRRKLHRVLSDGISECSVTLDDSVSEEDEDGSFDELNDTPYLQPGVELSVLNEWINSGHAVYAEALWDHVTMEEQELAFKATDVIRVLDASHSEWWWGRGAEREAWFPSCFVRVRVNQEDSSTESAENVADLEASKVSHSSHHKEQMRTNVVQEIMNTERIYIKHLKDICEGYIRQCRKHSDMFTELQLKTIFSNIEDIYKFQKQFLKDLEKKYNKDQPHLSEIGSCFLLQGEGFSIYSEYCNTHPAACLELQRLMKSGRYKHFFESCRLLQQMINISIAGFLLTPVQKICKYPLQLGELLKYTPQNHSDYSGVCEAHEAMKNVARLINEKKRRLESIDTIAHWQVSILRWEGPDILELSSELIHSGEMTRIIRYGKMQQRSFFLFDHQLVFCKKDILRRDLLHYRGCMNMDQTEVLDVPDGRDSDLGLTLKNALRLRNAFTLEFMCMLCCRKAQDKQRWLEAFNKERLRVKEDQEMGMEISEEQRKRAITNARRAKQGKLKSLGYSSSVPSHHQNILPLHQRHVTIPPSVPQQQVFSLAEPPKRKPYHLLYSITRNAFFRK